MNEQYNGYSNFETWLAMIWMEKDETIYRYWQQAAKEAGNVTELASRLKAEHEAGRPDLEDGIYKDLLNDAMSRINWHEIASALKDD